MRAGVQLDQWLFTTTFFTIGGVKIIPKPPGPPLLGVERFHFFAAKGKPIGFTVRKKQAVGGIDILHSSSAGFLIFHYIRVTLLAHMAICILDFRLAGPLAQTQQSTSLVYLCSNKGGTLHDPHL
jgi:hypothetical protein